MTLRIRRSIYLFFIVFFFVFATLIILYSQGYQYNFKKNKLEKTGSLILVYRPKEASVFFNDEFKLATTVFDNFARISRLLPGEYKIIVKKTDYFDWKKKLIIQPKLTTFAQNIKLFKNKTLPLKLINNIALTQPIYEKNKMVFVKKENGFSSLDILDLTTDQEINLATTSATVAIINSSWDNKKVLSVENQLFKNKAATEFYVYNTENLNKKKIFFPLDLKGDQIKWDQNNNEILYYSHQNQIRQYDLYNDNEKMVLEIEPKQTQIKDFAVRENNFYLIILQNNNDYLTKLPRGEIKQQPHSLFLLNSQNYSFIDSPDLITLLDKIDNKLIVLNSNLKEIFSDSAKGAYWSAEKEQNKLLYYNDFEIIIYYQNEGRKSLISRFSQPIEEVVWYPDREHLVFNTKEFIKIVELDLRDEINIASYPIKSKIKNLFINNKGDKLYFLSPDSKELSDLYQIEIQ